MIMCNAFYLLEKMFICLFFLKNELYAGEFEIIESEKFYFLVVFQYLYCYLYSDTQNYTKGCK